MEESSVIPERSIPPPSRLWINQQILALRHTPRDVNLGVCETAGRSKKRILIIEDDKDILTLLSEYFGIGGYETIGCETPIRGLLELVATPIDLIVLDIELPWMSGFEVISIIRDELGLTVPIIVSSCRNDEITTGRLKDCGANDFIGKPFILSELQRMVDNFL